MLFRSYIKKALEGNGKKGLIECVEANSEFRVGTQANSRLVKFLVGGGWATTIIILVIQFIR